MWNATLYIPTDSESPLAVAATTPLRPNFIYAYKIFILLLFIFLIVSALHSASYRCHSDINVNPCVCIFPSTEWMDGRRTWQNTRRNIIDTNAIDMN